MNRDVLGLCKYCNLFINTECAVPGNFEISNAVSNDHLIHKIFYPLKTYFENKSTVYLRTFLKCKY